MNKNKRNINEILLNKNMNLSAIDQIVLIIIIIILSIMIIATGIITKQSKENQVLLVHNSLEEFSMKQNDKLEEYVKNKIDILRYISSFEDVYGMNETKQKDFIKGRSDIIGFQYIFVVDTNGIGYYIDENVFRDQKNEKFYSDIMSNDTFITKPFFEKNGNSIIMTLCVSLYNENKQKVGVLCGAVDLFEIQKMFLNNGEAVNDLFFLINREGCYMASEDIGKVKNQLSIFNNSKSETHLIKEVFQQKKNQIGKIILEGIEYQICASYLESYDWVLVIGVNREFILKDLDSIDRFRYYLTFLNVMLILCIIRIIICWRLSDRKINIDMITKCSSRAAIERAIKILDTTEKHDIGVIYFDLNNFKEINDTYGHKAGDEVLSIFSHCLLRVFSRIGFVGRLGGDEFICFITDNSEEEIVILLKELELILDKENRKKNLNFNISFSYGIAFKYKQSNQSIRSVIHQADENMYRHKLENRNARKVINKAININ